MFNREKKQLLLATGEVHEPEQFKFSEFVPQGDLTYTQLVSVGNAEAARYYRQMKNFEEEIKTLDSENESLKSENQTLRNELSNSISQSKTNAVAEVTPTNSKSGFRLDIIAGIAAVLVLSFLIFK